MFGTEDVKQLVESAKRALEAEDRHLANCFKARHWKGREYGICDNQNERYYQFLIWSELMRSFPWRSRTERGGRDLTFFDNGTDKPVAYAEIKLYFNKLEGIRRDMEKLGEMRKPGVMLILNPQLIDEAKPNLARLSNQLEVSLSNMETASFPISTNHPGNWEFAVVGFLANRQASPASV